MFTAKGTPEGAYQPTGGPGGTEVVVESSVVGAETEEVVEVGAVLAGWVGSFEVLPPPTPALVQADAMTSTTKAGIRRDMERHLGMYPELPA
jgi:hypothetical protein